jgi:acyl-coenzyme A thioesterase PaaI-like protein
MTHSTDSAEQRAIELRRRGWKERLLGGFIDVVGPLWTCKEEGGGWAYGMLVKPEHLNLALVAHGGLLETLIDHVLSSVAWEAAGRQRCVTVQLYTHFIAAVHCGEFVEGRGQLVRRTGSLMFMQGTVAVDGQTVLNAHAVMKAQVGAAPSA